MTVVGCAGAGAGYRRGRGACSTAGRGNASLRCSSWEISASTCTRCVSGAALAHVPSVRLRCSCARRESLCATSPRLVVDLAPGSAGNATCERANQLESNPTPTWRACPVVYGAHQLCRQRAVIVGLGHTGTRGPEQRGDSECAGHSFHRGMVGANVHKQQRARTGHAHTDKRADSSL